MADGRSWLDGASLGLESEDFLLASVDNPASLPRNAPPPEDRSLTKVLPLRVLEYPGVMQRGPPGELAQVMGPARAQAMPRKHPEAKDEELPCAEDYFNQQGHTSTVSSSPSMASPNLSLSSQQPPVSMDNPASLTRNATPPEDRSLTEVLPLCANTFTERVLEYPSVTQRGPPGEPEQVKAPPRSHAMPKICPEVKDEELPCAEDFFNQQENGPHISNIHHHTSGHTSTVSNSPSVASPNLSLSSQQPPVSSSVPVGCVIPRVVASMSSQSSGLSSSPSKLTGKVAINSRVEVKASQVINTGNRPHAELNQLITNRETLNAVNLDCSMKIEGSLVKDSFNQTGHVQGTNDGDPTVGIMSADGDPAGDILTPHREFKTRNYQMEIAERSLNGHNDIIILPTGTGKTYVAIYIILEHLKRRGDRNSKVLFMVPTGVLAQQQHDKICQFLPSDKKQSCVKITGDDGNFGPDRMEETFKDPVNLVFVLTPQMLDNYLHFLDFEAPPTLADFSLLIFDECHHADKKHVYNKLLFRYMDLSKQPAYAARLPQILGLTATVGVGESKKKSDAVDFIIGLVARMHLSAPPSRVTDNLQELYLHTSRPVSNSWEMTYHTIDEFTKIIDQTMAEIEKMVITKLGPDFKVQFYGDRTAQAYTQDCIKLTGVLSIRLEHEHLREDTHFCIVAVEHLKVYARALDIAALARRLDCVKYINKKLSKPENTKIAEFKRSFEETKEKLDTVARYLDEKTPNAKLTHLHYLLNKIVSEKGAESRVLIFAQQRSVCHSLATWLATLGDQWKPRPFTSQGKSAEDVGMSPAQQTVVRSGFDNGKYNVLVSTSLAEEGIDIQDCNAVIKYMYIKDMRSSVQIRGRTRAMVGVVYSIVDAKLEKKEKENREKERWMIEAMETIREMESGDFSDRVQKEKDTMYEEMKQEFLEKTKKNRLKQSAGDILCVACGAKLSCVSNIRCYMHSYHLVFDRDLLDNKVTPYPDPNPGQSMDGVQPYGQFLCAGARCAKRIGTIVIVKGMTLAKFSIKSIRVRGQNTFKKWSDLKERYIVTELSYRALLKDGPSNQIACP